MPEAATQFTMRQSNLATFSRCPLSARFELEAGERHAPELARGTLAHRVVEEVFRTLRRTGERSIPVAEALEVMHEVMAQRDVPSEEVLVIPPEERLNLRQFVVRFASDWTWDTPRILAAEERLWLEIKCDDGVARTLTGSPDIIIAEPPEAIVVVDFKSGWGPPKTPKGDEVKEERRYLTERGHYQLDAYGLLALHRYPRAQRVGLREIHPRASEERTAWLERADMPEIERLIGIDLMLMDRAVQEGSESPIWKPVPGKQCAWCIRRRSCPRPPEERGEGGIQDAEMALEVALDIEVVTPKREGLIKAAKAWVDANGPIPLPDGRVLGWRNLAERGRRFEVHWPEEREAAA